MARRRSVKDLLTPTPTPERQLEHGSGWCITEYHDACPYQFSHGRCGCWCHTGKPRPEKIVDEDAPKKKRSTRAPKATATSTTMPETKATSSTTVMEDDPRPWRKNA